MKRILLIGIGAGDPEHLTVQAINGLNRADVLFVLDKPEPFAELQRLRVDICERYIREPGYRLVQVRDPGRQASDDDYSGGVERWHQQRAVLFEQLIEQNLGCDQTGAFLVWGDPALYDGTMRILEQILAMGRQAFDYEVIPGISSVQALAARHRVTLNRIGEPIVITPARRLGEQVPENTVVMLDAQCCFERYLGQGLHIYWGAYLGTPDELLVAGPLDDVCEQIKRVRHEARERKGWIMDTYLLRHVGAHTG